MKLKKLVWSLCATALLAVTLMASAQALQRPVKVLITGEVSSARILSQEGTPLQELVFDGRGQAVAGPLPPGNYALEAGEMEAEFTLKPNGALTQVEGDGWTDGEILHFTEETTGRLTVLYEGEWRWNLWGENADQGRPVLSHEGDHWSCTFEGLPFGSYVLQGEEKDVPILLRGEEPEQLMDLRSKPPQNVGPLG